VEFSWARERGSAAQTGGRAGGTGWALHPAPADREGRGAPARL